MARQAAQPAAEEAVQAIMLHVGQIIGYWTLLSEVRGRPSGLQYRCRCVCGVKKDISARSLRLGISKSCGCASGIMAKVTEEERRPLSPEVQRQLHFIAQGYLPPADQFTTLTSAPCWNLESVATLLGLSLERLEQHIMAGGCRFQRRS
jgi:hypothetical protein